MSTSLYEMLQGMSIPCESTVGNDCEPDKPFTVVTEFSMISTLDVLPTGKVKEVDMVVTKIEEIREEGRKETREEVK